MTSDPTIVTPEKIALYRSQLADNPDALAALDIIEKDYDGNLAYAAQAIAMENGIEGVMDMGPADWFSDRLEECRRFICLPKYKDLREKYVPALIPPVADCLAGSLGCPPGVGGMIAAPFAVYIAEEGMGKFCQSLAS